MENTNSVCLKMCMILEFGPLLEIKYQFVYGPSITHYGDHFATKKKALKLDKQ
jgi:hypothetical protein